MKFSPFHRFFSDDQGQGLAEHAFLCALIAGAAIAVFFQTGISLADLISTLTSKFLSAGR